MRTTTLAAGTVLAAGLAFGVIASPADASFVTSADAHGDQLFIDKEGKGVTVFCGTVGGNKTCDGSSLKPNEIKIATNTTVDTGNGFATIKPSANKDPSLTTLTFTPEISTVYKDFYFRGQLFADATTSTPLTVKVTDQFNDIQTFIFASIKGNANFASIGIMSIDNDRIKSVEISFFGFDNKNKEINTGFKDVKQVQFASAPIPAALPLLASAVVGLGFAAWRRRSETA